MALPSVDSRLASQTHLHSQIKPQSIRDIFVDVLYNVLFYLLTLLQKIWSIQTTGAVTEFNVKSLHYKDYNAAKKRGCIQHGLAAYLREVTWSWIESCQSLGVDPLFRSPFAKNIESMINPY